MVANVATASPHVALRGEARRATTPRQSRYPLGGAA